MLLRVSRALKYVVGKNLADLRRSRDLTQEQLAEQLNLSVRYLAALERGERNMTLDTLDSLADRLGCSAQDLVRTEG